MIKIELSEKQVKLKESLDFLFETHDLLSRESGRTTVMALSIIECALKNPRSPVYFFDHYLLCRTGIGLNRCMEETIRWLLNTDENIEYRIDRQKSSLTIIDVKNLKRISFKEE